MRISKRIDIITLVILITVLSIIIFFPFLTGKRYYFVNSSDSFLTIYPDVLAMHDQIYACDMPMWSFNKGLGQMITSGNPSTYGDIFNVFIAILPRNAIVYALSWVMVLKILFAGVFFYLYLDCFEYCIDIKILGALLYAFNGHMLVWGPWQHYATEMVFLPLLFFSIERAINSHSKWVFSVALAMLVMSRNVSYIWIYSLYIFGYVSFRLFFKGYSLRGILLSGLKFIPFFILGIGISSVTTVPGVLQLIGSGRLEKSVNYNFWGIDSLESVLSAWMKSFAPEITGITSTGVGDILADQVYYIGILSVMIFPLPLAIKELDRRKKLSFLFILVLIALYTIFEFPRRFMNMFHTDYIKTCSTWVSFCILICGVYALNNLNKIEKKYILFIVCIELAIYIAAILHRLSLGKEILTEGYVSIVIIALFLLIILSKFKDSVKHKLVIGVSILEIIYFFNVGFSVDCFSKPDFDYIYSDYL